MTYGELKITGLTFEWLEKEGDIQPIAASELNFCRIVPGKAVKRWAYDVGAKMLVLL
jgi:hypothetical protein